MDNYKLFKNLLKEWSTFIYGLSCQQIQECFSSYQECEDWPVYILDFKEELGERYSILDIEGLKLSRTQQLFILLKIVISRKEKLFLDLIFFFKAKS